jgi:hypothetical protein
VKGGERDRASSGDAKEEKRKGKHDRVYSAVDPFEPAINTATGSSSTHERNESTDGSGSDLMQHMFKEFLCGIPNNT